MDYYEDTGWLEEYVPLSEPLSRALGPSAWGGRIKRVMALDALAEELNLNVERIRRGGYRVLDSMLQPLQEAMDQGPGSWHDESERHARVVERGSASVGVEDVLDALHQFQWDRQRLPRETAVSQVESELRAILNRSMAQRLFKALERWRKQNVWNDDMVRRAERTRPPRS